MRSTKKTQILLFLLCSVLQLKAQLQSDSLKIDGIARTFSYKKSLSNNAPLIFVLHGSGGNGKEMSARTSKLLAISDTENMLLVYPDGYKRYWNECRKSSPAAANIENINEEGFFEAMIDYFTKNQHINPNNIFVVGTSGGGHMAYKLGLTMPQKLNAITAIIANLPDTNNLDCGEAKKALPLMIINGTEDKINPYNGGEVILGQNQNMGFVRSTERTFKYWATLAGYSGEPVFVKIPDSDPNDGKTIERFTFKEVQKPEIVLLKVIGGKHDYPNDIDVHVEAWEFFKRQIK